MLGYAHSGLDRHQVGMGPAVPLLSGLNALPIWAKLPHLWPEEEIWLDVHLYKLMDKRVIGPILLCK